MSEEKELTLDLIEEINEDFNEQKEVTIKVKTKDGYIDSKIKIDKAFSKAKIKECVKELIQRLDTAKIYMQDKNDSQSIYKLWLILLLIKHFTTLEIPKGFKNQLAVLEKLINIEVLHQIFAEFKTEEISKVMDEIEAILHIANTKINSYEPIFKEIEKQKIEDKKSELVLKEILDKSIEKYKTKK